MKKLTYLVLAVIAGTIMIACAKQEPNIRNSSPLPATEEGRRSMTNTTNTYEVTWEVCSSAIVEPSPNANGCVSKTNVLHGIDGNPPSQGELVSNASLVRPPETDLYSVGIESGGCGDTPSNKGVYEVSKIAISENSEPPSVSLKNVQPVTESTKSNPGGGMVVGGSACPRL
jgi:hypothetical protein